MLTTIQFFFLPGNKGKRKEWDNFRGTEQPRQGSDFHYKENSIVLDVFIFNMRNEVNGKQLCIETLTPLDALHFEVVREEDQIFYQRISRGLPKTSVIRFNEGWHKSTNREQTGFFKREPVNEKKSQRGDKCDNCGNRLKFNHWKNCPARIIICFNCGGRGHFAKHCKETGENKSEATNEFTHFNTNEICRLDLGHDKEKIAISTM